jgi:hypothetical protein
VFVLSCHHKNTNNDPQLARALGLAGKNRPELQKVLDHYSGKADSLKYKAAVFLIKYMPGKYAKVSARYNDFMPIFDTLSALNSAYEKVFKMNNFEFYKHYKRTLLNRFIADHKINIADPDFEIKEDLTNITANYLIENIDYAFKGWQMPWNKNVSFADFCEYILPYRYGHEELQPWRKLYFEKNTHLLDTFKNEQDPVKVCMFLKKMYYTTFSEIAELQSLGDAIKPLDLIRINTSTSCRDETGLFLLRLRGLGIAVNRITIPIWGNRGSGHDINAVLTAGNKWRSFGRGFTDALYTPPVLPTPFKPTKYYAEIYCQDSNSVAITKIEEGYQTDSGCVDVTRSITDAVDLKVPFVSEKDSTKACLLTFNNADWVPVAGSVVKNGMAVFPQMGKSIVYMPGTIRDGEIQLNGEPFLLDSSGVMNAIAASKDSAVVTLSRKYQPNGALTATMPTLEGCYFQGSNDSSFSKGTTLWKIEKVTNLHALKRKVAGATYQYIRLVYPDVERQNEALGGIQIYGINENRKIALLNGMPISPVKASEPFYKNVFDNNPLTFIRIISRKNTDFDQFYEGEDLVIPDKQFFWVGLKFRDKMKITSLELSPRTDNNDINEGEPYELFYWKDKAWASLGKKTARSEKINFTVPRGGLYLLKNLNGGKENRIFLYKQDQQVWY